GVDAITVVGDLTDYDAAEAVVAETRERLGPVDVVMHAVGFRQYHLVAETPIDEWRKVVDTNCTSMFYLARLLIPSMSERGFGRFLAIAGSAAYKATAKHGHIAASKAGLIALMKTIALEAGPSGVTANLVSPTITEAPQIPGSTPTTEQLRTVLPIPRPG